MGEQVFLSVQKEKVISISVVINIYNLLFKAFVLENARAGQLLETVSIEGLTHTQGLLSQGEGIAKGRNQVPEEAPPPKLRSLLREPRSPCGRCLGWKR